MARSFSETAWEGIRRGGHFGVAVVGRIETGRYRNIDRILPVAAGYLPQTREPLTSALTKRRVVPARVMAPSHGEQLAAGDQQHNGQQTAQGGASQSPAADFRTDQAAGKRGRRPKWDFTWQRGDFGHMPDNRRD